MSLNRRTTVMLALSLAATSVGAQQSPSGPPRAIKPAPPVTKEGPDQLRLGRVRVNTATKEVSVTGHINENDNPTLEWVANTQGGFKAYESAITLDTDAVTFNTALLLIGLDNSHARVPTRHFDPIPPSGDGVEVWVDWKSGEAHRRARVEQLLFDKRTNASLVEGPWVYTGSAFIKGTNQFLAENDGVLIGFVHSPAPLIENPRAGAVDGYGSVVLNRSLIAPGTFVTLTVKALGRIVQ